MKKIVSLSIVAVAALLTVSCGGKKERKDAWVAPEHEARMLRMPDYQLTDSVRVGAHVYAYDIVRLASDSLPMVKDDMDDFYADNTIALSIRKDGNTYFQRTFTKATFASSISETDYAASILDGIRFVKAEAGQGLTFSFAVSYPESDMSILFLLTVADDGTFSFVKNENLEGDESDTLYLHDEGV